MTSRRLASCQLSSEIRKGRMSAKGIAVADTAGKTSTSAGNDVALQETMLEAALEAFAQRGYDGVSVRELNRQIGVSHNLAHHYFGSKDALWRAAIDYGC